MDVVLALRLHEEGRPPRAVLVPELALRLGRGRLVEADLDVRPVAEVLVTHPHGGHLERRGGTHRVTALVGDARRDGVGAATERAAERRARPDGAVEAGRPLESRRQIAVRDVERGAAERDRLTGRRRGAADGGDDRHPRECATRKDRHGVRPGVASGVGGARGDDVRARRKPWRDRRSGAEGTVPIRAPDERAAEVTVLRVRRRRGEDHRRARDDVRAVHRHRDLHPGPRPGRRRGEDEQRRAASPALAGNVLDTVRRWCPEPEVVDAVGGDRGGHVEVHVRRRVDGADTREQRPVHRRLVQVRDTELVPRAADRAELSGHVTARLRGGGGPEPHDRARDRRRGNPRTAKRR